MEQYSKFRLFECGTQGFTGLLENNKKENFVFKVSKKIDFNTEHEFNVLKRLELVNFCPNFIKVFQLIDKECEPNVKKGQSPFKIESKYPIIKKVLIEEYVEGKKFYHHIKNNTVDLQVVYATVRQTLSAVALGQALVNLSHYDLHSENIILTPCDKHLVYLYRFNDSLAFAAPTYGFQAKIIDFGFSFVDNLRGEYLDPSMGHTDVGFLSDRFDWVADPKLFLISVKHELEKYRKNTELFSYIVKNLFSGLDVQWDSGWDKYNRKSATDYLVTKLEASYKPTSKIFNKYINFSVDLLCNLIVLPMDEKPSDNLFISYAAFVKEFLKIEQHFISSQYTLYILKCTVESARRHKQLYFEDTTKAVSAFRKDVNGAIQSVSSFCSPKLIHYEKMLVSLYTFASCAEGFFHNFFNTKMTRKFQDYRKIPVKGILDILQILNVNLPESYTYSIKTQVIVVDMNSCLQTKMVLDDQIIQTLNTVSHELRGAVLNQYYTKTKVDFNKQRIESEEEEGEDAEDDTVESEEEEGEDAEDDTVESEEEEGEDTEDDTVELEEEEGEGEDTEDDTVELEEGEGEEGEDTEDDTVESERVELEEKAREEKIV